MNPLKITQQQFRALPYAHKLIVACSGGVDSVVLAHILKRLGYDLVTAHFNHGWRGVESDADEQLVKHLAKTWNLPIEVKRGKKTTKGNAENQARIDRYAFLESIRLKHQANYTVVAHHQDDQMETILMHQKRGAGLRGLAGMPFQRGFIIRPLLEVPKQDLVAYARTHQLPWREDVSNQDLNFTRNHLRQVEIPKLKAQDPDFEQKLLKKSHQARQKLEALKKKAQEWVQKNLKEDTFSCNAFSKLSNELQSEVLIQLLGQKDVYRATLKRLKDWIENGRSGSRIQVKNQTFCKEHGAIYIQNDCQKRRRDYGISPASIKKIKITKKGTQWGPYQLQKLTNEPLFVRNWQPGDRFKPAGLGGTKKVQDFFVDQKVPLHERQKIPLIVNEKGQILAISHWRVAQGHEHLKKTLKINVLQR